MMNRTEHFLACLAEECDEVGQRVMKALRFGLFEIQPGQPLDNAERIAAEYADLVAVYELLREIGAVPVPEIDIEAKRTKIETHMHISRRTGALE